MSSGSQFAPLRLRLVRDTKTEISTIGKLFIQSSPTAYSQTLEPPIKTDGTKPRAIPCGVYPVTVRWSKRFGREVPHIENVPGFDEVEIHIGNSAADTHACVLVGKTRSTDWISHSADVFEPLLKLLKAFTSQNPGKCEISIEEEFSEAA